MSDSHPRTFGADFKRFFLRGLVVLLPSVLTLWIVVKAYQFVDQTIAQPINASVRTLMTRTAAVWEPMGDVFNPTEEEVDAAVTELAADKRTDGARARELRRLRKQNVETWWNNHWAMDFIGIVVAIISVYIAGRLVGGFFGRRLYRRVEKFIISVPIFKQVYPYIKQIVDFLFSDDQPIKFNRVVAAEYPRKGIWSVGFATGQTLRSVAEKAGDSMTIFIPSSPTPFTGYTITVPRADVVEIPISVEEAIRFAVSGGVLVPDHQVVGMLDKDQARGTPGASGLIPIPTDGSGEGDSEADAPDASNNENAQAQ